MRSDDCRQILRNWNAQNEFNYHEGAEDVDLREANAASNFPSHGTTARVTYNAFARTCFVQREFRPTADVDPRARRFSKPKSQPVKQVAQKNLEFVPPLLPVQVNTRVEFPNLDDAYHSIFSYSPAKRFDLGRYRPEERPIPSEIFDRAGLVTLRCDIHEHMRGLILVLNTPYFVMTDPEGRFRLGGLPSGHYTLRAWIDSKTTREKTVTLKSGETARVDFP